MSKKELIGRPYTVCHMISTLDGQIDGRFFSNPKMNLIRETSANIRKQLDCEAVICGLTTTVEVYSEGVIEKNTLDNRKHDRRTDYIASSDTHNFYVSIDPDGCVRWKEKYVEKRGCPRSHIVEVLTEMASDDYIDYLHRLDISYIFAGEKFLDCSVMMSKLKQKFNIQRAMISGGGVTNWSFLKAGMIDEISLILCPFSEGDRNAAVLFEQSLYMPKDTPEAFTLTNVQTLPEDALWLIYHPQNVKK